MKVAFQVEGQSEGVPTVGGAPAVSPTAYCAVTSLVYHSPVLTVELSTRP